MKRPTTRTDLHIHSRHSTRAADWVLRRLDFPASASDPLELYGMLRAAGMRFVTLTDQNTIEGCLEIAHMPDVILGEEVATVFPEDDCRIHVLVWGLNEAQHREIEKARESIYDLQAYLFAQNLAHAVAHPFHSLNGKLGPLHLQKLSLMFRHFEGINGRYGELASASAQSLLGNLTPRHIEIQVLGDGHGNCVYLWERECSIQRRHQKVIEEAPSPFLDEKTRKAMGEQAVALARAVDYQSAGTVEFVVGKDKGFYFLEMNTRLQVEHPVTECITGLDLVEQMIRVAAGEKLGFRQQDIARNGWAIECRINAEDPFRNFLPSTGRLVKYRPPNQNMEASQPVPPDGGVRVDTGVYEGGEIPMFYDSMIAKLIVHGKDRNEAISRMREALNGFVIRGISSNIPFQAALLAHPRFVAGDFNTGFIAEQYPKGFSSSAVPHDEPGFLLSLAAVSHRRSRERAATLTGQRRHREVRIREDFVIVLTDEGGKRDQIPVAVRPIGSMFHVTLAGKTHEVAFEDNLRDIAVHGQFDGEAFCAQIERIGLGYRISHNGSSLVARVYNPRAAELEALMPFKAPPDLSKVLISPMPGLLVDVAVQPGQTVRAGERLAAIEAMKMENILFATQDCVVGEVLAKKGDSLAVDQVIMRFQ